MSCTFWTRNLAQARGRDSGPRTAGSPGPPPSRDAARREQGFEGEFREAVDHLRQGIAAAREPAERSARGSARGDAGSRGESHAGQGDPPPTGQLSIGMARIDTAVDALHRLCRAVSKLGGALARL